jgi:hypothetical protein
VALRLLGGDDTIIAALRSGELTSLGTTSAAPASPQS